MTTMTDTGCLIRLDRIHRTYRAGDAWVYAIRGVSLEIATGESLAIVGPSGSGKSTLMNILGLLDRPDEGQYWLGGVDVSDLDAETLARLRNRAVGFVFQNFQLLARSTALENVELPLLYRSERLGGRKRRARALEALDAVGLSARAGHLPHQLSGGEQQRVSIARALVNQPALLLADEPTGNLDSKKGEEIMELFLQLHKAGLTVVMITHDAHVAEACGRQVVLHDGRLQGDWVSQPDPGPTFRFGEPTAPRDSRRTRP